MKFDNSTTKKSKKLEFEPQPPPKYLTTRGLIARGIIFISAVTASCYLLWQEFGW